MIVGDEFIATEGMGRRDKQRVLELLIKRKEMSRLRPIDVYEPHEKQLLFHKSKAKTRGLIGGNRCLREDQGVITRMGPRAIGDIGGRIGEVLSFDRISSQFRWMKASPSFAKGKSCQYRVVHERGEFVADGSHLIFLGCGTYQSVDRLSLGDGVFQSPLSTSLGFDQSGLFSDEEHLKKINEDFLGDCQVYNYSYGQLPLVAEEVCQVELGQCSGGEAFYEPACHDFFSHEIHSEQRLKHIHH